MSERPNEIGKISITPIRDKILQLSIPRRIYKLLLNSYKTIIFEGWSALFFKIKKTSLKMSF